MYYASPGWGTPPQDFNHSTLVLLPEKPPIKCNSSLYYAAKDTRPLSIVNTDNRIVANALRDRLARFAGSICNPSQRGFLPNRRLIDNVVEIDFECRQAYVRGKRGALVLVDFSAAFPSLSQDFMFKVLEKQNVPEQYIRAIQQLYKGNMQFIQLEGSTTPSFCINSGVRQGCPLSPILFALALLSGSISNSQCRSCTASCSWDN
jgi:hypothetical protein